VGPRGLTKRSGYFKLAIDTAGAKPPAIRAAAKVRLHFLVTCCAATAISDGWPAGSAPLPLAQLMWTKPITTESNTAGYR
jgi:hypothetical protein